VSVVSDHGFDADTRVEAVAANHFARRSPPAGAGGAAHAAGRITVSIEMLQPANPAGVPNPRRDSALVSRLSQTISFRTPVHVFQESGRNQPFLSDVHDRVLDIVTVVTPPVPGSPHHGD